MIKLLIAYLVALFVAAGIAHADTVPDKAKALAERGRQLHHDGNYTDAIEAYKAAYVLAPSPGLLFNLAQSYRLAGDCDDAAWMYHRYLETQPNDESRAVAAAHLARLEACSNRGGFRTALAASSVPQATTLSVTSDSTQRPPPLFTTEPPGRRSKQVGTGLIVGGGGALVLAAVFAVDAYNAQNEISDAYSHHDKPDDIRALDERGQRSATIAKVLGVGGGLAAISGAVLYGLGRHYEQANHVAVTPHANGAAVSLTWGF